MDTKRDEISQRRSQLSLTKQALFAKRLQGKVESTELQVIPRRSQHNPAPLSFAQERLWLLDQLESGISIYNMSGAILLKGRLNFIALEASINEIINRHEILRTSLAIADGQPIQTIKNEFKFTLPTLDLRNLSATERQPEVQRLLTQEQKQPFDLTKPGLLRVTLLQLGELEHLMLFTIHHIIADVWSRGVFFGELTVLYEAFCVGKPSPLPELPIQYADYAVWQRQWLREEVLQTHLTYWQQQLQGDLPILNLPSDRPRSAIQTYQGASQSFLLPKSLTQALKDLSRREEVTLFMTLLAAFQTLLYRYTQQDDILVGSPFANRNREELEGLIGFLVNTLILRGDLSGNPSFRELLSRVREVVLGAIAHQDLPFEKFLETLKPHPSLRHKPPFQVMFSLQNLPEIVLEMPEITLSLLEVENKTAFFDVVLSMRETEQGLTGTLEYNTDLFDADTITRMLGHFQTLLTAIVTNPDEQINYLPLLTQQEKLTLQQWQQISTHYPKTATLHQLFEAQVERTPDAIAVIFDDQKLTYQELNRQANKLAHQLQSLGVESETKVGLCVERSPHMIVGILGILKAGGAYIPLDPNYPQERLNFIWEDAQISVLVTQTQLLEKFTQHSTPVIAIDALQEIGETISCSPLSIPFLPDNLAYVIYTSGSTGKPKGVLCTHYNVVRLFQATQSWFNFSDRDVFSLFHSIAFDFSVWEIWAALLNGGRLVIVPYWVSRSPEAFYDLLHQQQVTVLNQTPSAFRQLIRVEETPENLKDLQLRLVIFGGEALELSSLQPWFEHHGDKSPQLINMYGITETTVHVTYRPIAITDLHNHSGSAIGCPIPDLQIYLLDPNQQPVPIGIPGEMYIGGAGLARGYLNRPELTSSKFLTNPFNNSKFNCLYRSGDLARYLPSGNIEYLGRIDNQVKIRGFRIELGEIETALAGHPDVAEVTVIVREDIPKDQRLVAYIVPRREKTPVLHLRDFLKEKLPEYMLPSAFVILDTLPLTSNGKIDQKALLAPEQTRQDLRDFVAPYTPIEKALAEIWSQLLRISAISIHDNFFEMGGHSLLATQLVSRVREHFQIELPLKIIFTTAFTIAELAQIIRQYQLEQTNTEDITALLQELSELSDKEALIIANKLKAT
ncbi:MAG: amino acid adenylation domain-containing protein [Desmonostoc vinosum HA7617-LM4]|jgi:amino acid adenylation domain-containing protein|nr:amino acid adenylation domain-containing protein [Desmonostoc vinosum HA7617-LM4]